MNGPDLINDPQAMRRHLLLSAFRFSMVGLTMLGIAVTYDAVTLPDPLPKELGIVFAFGGMFGFFLGPKWLVRGWKTPKDDAR